MLKTQACLLIVAALLVSQESWAQSIFDRHSQNNQPELLEPEAQPQNTDHLGAEGGPLNGSTTPSGTSTTTPTDSSGTSTGTTTQTTTPSAPAKVEPDPAQVCSNYFLKQHPKLHPLVMEHQYCAESPLRSLFTAYSSEWERNAMSRCLKTVGDDAQVDSKLINRCTSYSFRSSVEDGSYRNCVTEVVAAHREKPKAIEACSAEYGSNPARVIIETCAEDLHDTRFMSFERDAICGNQTARREYRSNPQILDCIAKGRDVAQMKIEAATASCVMSARRSSILSTDFDPCLVGLKELGLNHQGRNVCLDAPSAYARILPDPAFRSCALRGKAAGFDGFFKLQTAVTDATYGNESDVLSDCKKDLTAPKATGPWTARVLGDLHLHTSSAWKFDYHWDPINIGGLSGISYDSVSGKFLTVSDSKRLSAVFQMAFQLPTEPGQVLKLDGVSITDIGSGFQVSEMLDHEDIALTKNGDMIISSELSIDTKKEDRDLQIVRYNPRGHLESKILLPKDFEPGYEKKQAPVQSDAAPHANSGGSSGNDGFSKSNPNGYTSSSNPGYNTGGGSSHGGQYYSGGQSYSAPAPQTSGLTANSGIEGIALSLDETYLIAANEKALKQDAEGSVRLAILSIVEKADNSAAPMLTYTLDKLPGAGLVAMAFADPTTLLTLERGFDDVTHKNSVRIYKSKLEIQAGLPVAIGAKHLIADIFLMVPQFSPGFRAIDNFEGMTFGPTLPSGNRTLVLVSDNNFNVHGQRTAFVVLELAKDALN